MKPEKIPQPAENRMCPFSCSPWEFLNDRCLRLSPPRPLVHTGRALSGEFHCSVCFSKVLKIYTSQESTSIFGQSPRKSSPHRRSHKVHFGIFSNSLRGQRLNGTFFLLSFFKVAFGGGQPGQGFRRHNVKRTVSANSFDSLHLILSQSKIEDLRVLADVIL